MGPKKKLTDNRFDQYDIDRDVLLRPAEEDATDDNTVDAFEKADKH